jgi:uncharacterized protein (TIRG00374 family)
VVALIIVWCIVSFRGDLQKISFAPLLQNKVQVLLAVALSLTNYAFRVVRWRWYLARLGHDVSPGFAALTYVAGFAFTLSPGKVGELVRARYYVPVGIPIRDVAAAFTVERLMDLVALLVLALLMVRVGVAAWAITAGAVLLIGTVLLTSLPRKLASWLTGSVRVAPSFVSRFLASLSGYLTAARALLTSKALVVGLVIALCAWGLEGLGLGVLGAVFAPGQTVGYINVGIYAVAVLLGTASFLPGGLGSTEAAMTALLTHQGYSIAAAVSTAIACRMVTLWLGVGVGWLAVAILRLSSTARADVPETDAFRIT